MAKPPACPHCGCEVGPLASVCGNCQKPLETSRLAQPGTWLVFLVLASAVGGGLWLKGSLARGLRAHKAIQEVSAMLAESERSCSLHPPCPSGLAQAQSLMEEAKELERRGDFERAQRDAEAAAQTLAQVDRSVSDAQYDFELAEADQAVSRSDYRLAAYHLLRARSMRPDRDDARQRLEHLRANFSPAPAPAPAAAPAPAPQRATLPPKAPASLPGMAFIPAGDFLMGSPKDAGGPDEHPQHKVWLDAFHIGQQEVSVAEYQDFCARTERAMSKQPAWSSPGHPVVNVSWRDARDYCRNLGQRLPTEAEWEMAAACGQPLHFPKETEESFMALAAWFNLNSQDRAHPVGLLERNRCGLTDVFGNVWEWVNDWYSPNYYDRSPARNPPGPRYGEEKVLRGGGFDSEVAFVNSTFRERFMPSYGKSDRGFRCAKRAP